MLRKGFKELGILKDESYRSYHQLNPTSIGYSPYISCSLALHKSTVYASCMYLFQSSLYSAMIAKPVTTLAPCQWPFS